MYLRLSPCCVLPHPPSPPPSCSSRGDEGIKAFASSKNASSRVTGRAVSTGPAPTSAQTQGEEDVFSRAQSGFSDFSDDNSPRGNSAQEPEPLSPIIKGAYADCDGDKFDPGMDGGVQSYLKTCFDMRTTPITKLCKGAALNLTNLNLDHRGIGSRGSTALAVFLRANSTLTELHLADNNIGPEGGAALFEGMAASNSIRILDMSSNKKIAPAIPTYAGPSVPGSAAASGSPTPLSTAVPLLVNSSPTPPSTTTPSSLLLQSSFSPSSTADGGGNGAGAVPAGLLQWVAKGSSLLSLDLSNCMLGDEAIKALAGALAHNENHTLACLRLGANDVSDDGAGALFGVLARCEMVCLREIDMQWNRLRDAAQIADALRQFKPLNPAPCTLHPTPYTLHPHNLTPMADALRQSKNLNPTILQPYTLHPTPYTLHPTPYIRYPQK